MNRMHEEKLNEIIKLMEERDYDPIAQLTGYIEIGSDDYITRHGGAREKIKEIDKEVIKLYLERQRLTMCLWHIELHILRHIFRLNFTAHSFL